MKNRTGLAIQIMGFATAVAMIILSFLGLYLPIHELNK